MDVNQTLVARNSVHGDFFAGAEFGQAVEKIMRTAPNWEQLSPGQVDALRVITQKIARIMFGDPNFADHWHDIAGYATIIDKQLSAATSPAPTLANLQSACADLGELANKFEDNQMSKLSPALQELIRNDPEFTTVTVPPSPPPLDSPLPRLLPGAPNEYHQD